MVSIFKNFPGPGSVFKEYHYLDHGHIGVVDPYARNEKAVRWNAAGRRTTHFVEVNDLEAAERAEVVVEYWGGHIGTTNQNFSVNGSEWIPIPQPKVRKPEPQYFYRTILGTNPMPVSLDFLREGANEFRFMAGPQLIRTNFQFGFYWVYDFTLRVYFDYTRKSPAQNLTAPAVKQVSDETYEFSVDAAALGKPVKQIDYIGFYEDFDYRGHGEFLQWQYQYQYGKLNRHIGTATEAPFTVKWDSSKIPDQEQPIYVIARITDNDGICHMTPVSQFSMERKNRSVKLYKPYAVPDCFGVRVGNKFGCKIDMNDELDNAVSAHLVISTWSADHADEIGLNDIKLVERVGISHDYSYDEIPVPIEVIKKGTNGFYIFSNTTEHSAEVNWPGPVLKIEYSK